MKIKYSIGLFVIIFVIAFLSVYIFNSDFKKTESEKDIVESVTADGQAEKEECYYLYEVNRYIVVFESDRKTPYEYTDILYDDLPELLRKEIQNGKYIKNLNELYGFLENYSS